MRVDPRGRGGSRQRAISTTYIRGHKDAARRRRRRHLRLADVRSRRAVDLLRPARPGLLPDRRARHDERSALGIVRRRRRQPRVRAGADPRAGEGQGRPHQDSRLLRRRARADRRGARRSSRSCRSTRRDIASELGAPKLFGETRLHHARARVGAADVRGQRPAVRVHRRRREDGDSGGRDGQGQHAPGARIRIRRRSAGCSKRR